MKLTTIVALMTLLAAGEALSITGRAGDAEGTRSWLGHRTGRHGLYGRDGRRC